MRAVILCLVCLAACGIDSGGAMPPNPNSGGMGGEGGSAPTDDLLAGADCDPMVPSHCGFPFPSDVWTRPDASSPTGKRVHFGATTLPYHSSLDAHLDPTRWNELDGFSIGQAPMTHLPGATVTGLPSVDDIALSLTKTSPTVLIDADTGMAVPHFAELDMTGDLDDQRAFMLRPVVRLKDATRYIVAIRHVVDAEGDELPPSDVFLALRDGLPHDDPSVAARREHYADLLGRIAEAGYDTRDLQLAWDFTTSSDAEKTGWLLHMRDDALAAVGETGPAYRITEVTENPNEHIRRRIKGMMTVPLYLESAEPGARMHLGADGMPEQNGTAEFEFMVQIPHSATTGYPGAPLQNGHGLLGRLTEGQDGFLARLANAKNFVPVTVNFVGFCEEDEPQVENVVAFEFEKFADIISRQHQGVINSLLSMRMVIGALYDDEAVKFDGVSAIDPTHAYYRGDSQGGIYGVTYMALTTDVERGLLGEPGGPYNLLLNRSVDFEPFFIVLKAVLDNYLDTQIALGLAQMFWDRTDPVTYASRVSDDLLPNTPEHNVLLHVAVGDYQVTPLGAHLLARDLGASMLTPRWRNVWRVPAQAGPFEGNGLVEWKFLEVPDEPKTNTPPTGPEDMDPHDWVRVLDAASEQTDIFLRQGLVQQVCDGICDPE
jgi:hypothetical protein